MTLEELKALPVPQLAAEDCVLFLWAVGAVLPGAIAVIESWGFEYDTVGFNWVKTTPNAKHITLDGKGLHFGLGFHTRQDTEFVLLGTRGRPMRLAKNVREGVLAPVGKHSEKPEEVRRRIERLYAGPYLELFGRKQVPGWTVWGNEVVPPSFLEAAE